MGNIVLLDDLTINQIAAGEVIERPANVVKELVENSLDAGAKKIVVEIKKGGKELIKVTDNGKGISKDDLFLSIERHATSKITNIDDLENTYTMGFRGEALASIASISEMTITSKTNEDVTGIKMFSIAGDILSIEDAGTPTGTTVEVKNLFFNTPVRYKFLKQDATEFRYIKEWLQKVALTNTYVSFKLINDGKLIFSVDGSGRIKDIIYKIYGKEIAKNLVDVNYKDEEIEVTGVIGNTMIAKESRKSQILFLNKRNIVNKEISGTLDQAFSGSVGIGKYGFCILNLNMPASFYDVNVHPTKMEVRFKSIDTICKVLYNAVKTSLLKSEFLGNIDKSIKENYVQNEYEFLTNNMANPKLQEDLNSNEIIKREQIRDIKYKYIGIIFRTFIVIEIENELFLVDQHAAHERILYEKIKTNYKTNMKNNTQLMLVPEIIDLSPREMDFILHNKRLFENCGFNIEIFGQNSVKISGIPDLEYRAKTKNLFLDILDEMITPTRSAIKDIEERFIATVACKAAVKANMDLSKQEAETLINTLFTLNNPYTCPHRKTNKYKN